MTDHLKLFNRSYWIVCAIVFVTVVLRCIYVPFSHDEVATFYFYIQPGNFLPFLSHVDANGHFLTSASGWVCFNLFGSSSLSLRLPSILAFIVLCYGISRINNLFSRNFPKILFSSAFILSFNFISFYSLCRGYGLSMAFLILALYYFFSYTSTFTYRHFFKFLIFSQLALSANLTLVFVLAITTGILILLQLKNKIFFSVKNILFLLLHFSLLFFWIRYAFFLQESGALYYGGGYGYWNVTFKTLIEAIAFKNVSLNMVFIMLFLGMFIYWCYRLIKEKLDFLLNNRFAISFFTLCSLMVSFYLLKKLINVNYPEDRTGLFFYVFFILSLGFMVNEFKPGYEALFAIVPVFFLIHFIWVFNIKVHPWKIYETMPEAFFDILKSEQKNHDHPITIGGHRTMEFFYGFLNYNSHEKLNHMTSPEALQMNCDYALAYKQDKPWYEKYYTELATDKYWDFTLLKRRDPIPRKMLVAIDKALEFKGSNEYYNAYEKLDTTFHSVNPLLAEFNVSVQKAPVPFNAWLVLQIHGENGETMLFRAPLNLIKYKWDGTANFTTGIVSGNIPIKIKRIVAYLWNIDKKELQITLNTFSLYQLKGNGVTEISKAKI